MGEHGEEEEVDGGQAAGAVRDFPDGSALRLIAFMKADMDKFKTQMEGRLGTLETENSALKSDNRALKTRLTQLETHNEALKEHVKTTRVRHTEHLWALSRGMASLLGNNLVHRSSLRAADVGRAIVACAGVHFEVCRLWGDSLPEGARTADCNRFIGLIAPKWLARPELLGNAIDKVRTRVEGLLRISEAQAARFESVAAVASASKLSPFDLDTAATLVTMTGSDAADDAAAADGVAARDAILQAAGAATQFLGEAARMSKDDEKAFALSRGHSAPTAVQRNQWLRVQLALEGVLASWDVRRIRGSVVHCLARMLLALRFAASAGEESAGEEVRARGRAGAGAGEEVRKAAVTQIEAPTKGQAAASTTKPLSYKSVLALGRQQAPVSSATGPRAAGVRALQSSSAPTDTAASGVAGVPPAAGVQTEPDAAQSAAVGASGTRAAAAAAGAAAPENSGRGQPSVAREDAGMAGRFQTPTEADFSLLLDASVLMSAVYGSRNQLAHPVDDLAATDLEIGARFVDHCTQASAGQRWQDYHNLFRELLRGTRASPPGHK